MSSLSFSKIFFAFSVVSITVISNAELVNDVCRKLGHKQFCLEVLKSDPRSKFAKDITTLTIIAVDVAAKHTTATRDYFLRVKTGSPAVLTSLKDCINSYNVVIRGFSNCFKEEDCSLIGYDIHDAGDEVRRCQAITDSNGAHDSFITTRNNVTIEFSGLGEALANLMCN